MQIGVLEALPSDFQNSAALEVHCFSTLIFSSIHFIFHKESFSTHHSRVQNSLSGMHRSLAPAFSTLSSNELAEINRIQKTLSYPGGEEYFVSQAFIVQTKNV